MTTRAQTLQYGTWVYPQRVRRRWRWLRLTAYWREASLITLGLFAVTWYRLDRPRPAAAAPKIDRVAVLSAASTVAAPHASANAPAAIRSASALPADTNAPGGSIAVTPGSTRNGYSFGNCTYFVASRRAVPGGWGNARSWYSHAVAAGYHVDNIPVPGAIAWTPLGWFGHVAYVEQVDGGRVLISEMNNYGAPGGGWNRVDKRWVSAGDFKYIY